MKNIRGSQNKDAFLAFIKIYALVQVGVIFFEIILPATSQYKNGGYRFLLNIVFYLLVVFVAMFIRDLFKKAIYSRSKSKVEYMSLIKLKFLLNVSTFLGFFGMVCIMFDRIFLKKIDYSLGLRHARYQWINASSPSVFSDLLSMFGNAIVPMAFISILLIYLHWENLDKRFRINRLFLSTISVFLFAAMNGSRSIVFIQVFLMVSVSILRIVKRKKIVPSKSNKKKTDKRFYIIVIISIFYALTVFNSSSKMGNIDSKSLFEIFVVDLGGEIRNEYYAYINNFLDSNSTFYHIFSAITYLIHSQWTSEALISLSARTGSIFMFSIKHFLYQSGVLSTVPEGYIFYGLFISLPGAIVYDFGVLGLLILGVLYGFVLGLALLKVEYPRSSGGFAFAFIMFVFSSILVAPFFVAHNFIYFNFIIVDMILLELLSRFFVRKSTWIHLELEKAI